MQQNNCVEIRSEETRLWLQKAGWKPGLPSRRFNRWNYGKSDDSWRKYCELFACRISRHATNENVWRCHPAREVLREFYGLEAHSPPFVRYLQGIYFSVDEAFGYSDEIADLSDLVSDYLLPFGDWDQAHALIGASGRVFQSGYACFGVIYCGESFSDAMNKILGGLSGKAVPLEDDRFDHSDLNCDGIWLPPA